MSIAANQYANKVFAEHPISMWSLDEQAYYISLIDDDDRRFSTWTGTGSTKTDYTSLPSGLTQSPFPSSNVYSSFTKSTSSAGTIQVLSPELFSATNVDAGISTFCVNFFLYQNPTYITAFRVGYKYNNSGGTPQTVISSNISPPSTSSWINFNNTYDIPTSWSGSIKIFIEVDFASSSGGDAASRTITMHGLSVGQGSESTCYTSLGVTPITLPTELNMSSMQGYPADQYGVLSNNGYFLVRNNSLLSHNDGLPIIYGTDNSTKIAPSGVSTIPSFVFPGKGMLHENGRNKRYTLEMWMKIDPSTTRSQKIVGPLDTSDGIYVKEGFLTLVIDNEIGSYPVSEWYRPMLLHVSIRENNATLMINGEQVIDIPFTRNSVTLSSLRDWWGIYSYTTTGMFEIDCISIFPYIVSNSVAKRRFIYGQGTPSIQSIDNSYQGTPTTIEFATAEYGASIIYPDVARWDAGYFSNLDATKSYLSVPNYKLPIINIGGRNLEQWYEDNLAINQSEYPDSDHPHFITFRPNIGTRTNLVPNPSATTTSGYWYSSVGSGVGTLQRTTSLSYLGSSCFSITCTGAGNVRPAVKSDSGALSRLQATAGKTYTFSVYVRSATIGRVVDTLINFVDSAGTTSLSSPSGTQITSTTTGWTRVSVTATAPSGTAYIEPSVRFISCLVGEIHYFDAALLEESSAVLSYFDGSYSDSSISFISRSWSGTNDGSSSIITYWNPDGIQYQENSYLNFPTLNILNDQVSAAYGVFEIESSISSERVLFSFSNSINGQTFDITINASTIYYKINGSVIHSEAATIGVENLVGINFEALGNAFGYEVSRFFSSPASVQVYVGGNGSDGSTFEGKIYLVGFANQTDYSNISDNFNSNGIAISDRYQFLFDHITSYTLIPEHEFGKLFLDISISGEWEEYFPLNYFGSYVNDQNGNRVYDIDMLQVNLGYTTVASSSAWTYAELRDDPVSSTYATLAASSYSTSYLSLKKKNDTGITVDVSASSLQSYITFQPLIDGANAPLSSFPYIKNLTGSAVIYADDQNTISMPERVYETKFVFRDNMVIYPPKVNDFRDYAAVIHLQLTQRSILKSPLKIKSFEISAKNLNYNSATLPNNQKSYIGTKWGKKAYIVSEKSTGDDYKEKNPILIHKSSTPYLYNTKKSGIRLVNESTSDTVQSIQNEIFIPINENGSYDYQVGALQIMVNPSFVSGTDNIKMFEVKHKDGTHMYTISKDGEKAVINVYDGTSGTTPVSGINFYQNGRYVKNPSIKNNEWTCIGIIFPNEIDFSSYSEGGIKLFGGFTFNNISYYLSSGLGLKSELQARTWQNVFTADGATPSGTTWSYWDGSTWQYVYITGQTTSYVTTPAEIYQAYVGTNSSIIDDNGGMLLKQSQAEIITNVTWQDLSIKPA